MADDKKCFVIMPILEPGTVEHTEYRALYDTVIRPPVVEAGYEVIRADDVTRGGAINADIIERLATADLVVADLSGLNPNVFYELGIRHSLRRHGTIMIINTARSAKPFDLQAYRMVEFSPDLLGYEKLREALIKFIKNHANSDAASVMRDSPVHDVLPSLPQDVYSLAEGSSEGKLREQIADLQGKLQRYAEKYGDTSAGPEGATEVIFRTLDQARRGELPLDLFYKAREAARAEDGVAFLTIVLQLVETGIGLFSVEQWIALSVDARVLHMSNVADVLYQKAIEQRPNDENLKRVYYSSKAHSEDHRQREVARRELSGILGIEVVGDHVTLKDTMRADQGPVFKLITFSIWLVHRLFYGVVPVTVKFVPDERKLLHLMIGHLDPFLVDAVIEFGSDGQPGSGGGAGDQVHHYLTTLQDAAAPVHGDVAEQAVLDFVPL
jgi:hypothetical protein